MSPYIAGWQAVERWLVRLAREFGTLVTGAVITLGLLAANEWGQRRKVAAQRSGLPLWVWLAVAFATITVAQFRVWRSMEKDRDDARDDLQRRFGALRYRFELGRLDGGAVMSIPEGKTEPETGYLIRLFFLNGGLEVLQYSVEEVSITVGGHGPAQDARFESTGGILLPGRERFFQYHWIPAPIDQPMLGRGEYTATYGHPTDGPRFRTHHAFAIQWEPMPDGRQVPNFLTLGKVTHDLIGMEKVQWD
jgi:hypothetical protein